MSGRLSCFYKNVNFLDKILISKKARISLMQLVTLARKIKLRWIESHSR